MVDLAASTQSFAEQLAALADAEEVESLTAGMQRLADSEARIARLHNKAASRDAEDFVEMAEEYIYLVASVRVSVFVSVFSCFFFPL